MVSESLLDRPSGDTSVTSDQDGSAQTVRDDTDRTDRHQSQATLVRSRLPTEAFALEETFRTIPDLTVEGAPVAATGNASMSLMWARTDEDDLTRTLAGDPTVSTVEELCRTGDRHCYRVEWSHDIQCCMEILLQSQGILLRSQGADSQWHLDLLYPDRETLQDASECCEQYELPLTIKAIRSLDADQQTQYGLTSVQHETLIHAHQQGYFNVPREISLQELAEQMDISHQALSERLRRGHNTLINATLSETQSTSSTIFPSMSAL